MKVSILDGRREEKFSNCTKVLVDIFRSTSTIPILFRQGAVEVIPTEKVSEARALRRLNPNFVTVGERYGIKIPGFDYNNSPSEIGSVNFSGKRVIFTSTNGTKVLHKIKDYGTVYIGSFLNFTPLLERISGDAEVEIVVSSRPDGKADEDYIFAQFLQMSLMGANPDFNIFRERIRKSQGARRLSLMGASKDIEASLDLDSCRNVPVFRDGKLVPST
ncbi:MAG TPA: 2-phosphosulfolactate phosphatase [Thermoplasmataceae archaeon]|nr:2-phosphosulfolactate phosphatase [Thermoplasmataceae archaeon]